MKVDEDYKRNYPYDTLASKVLGFTGGDNQGIIGLESVYDKYLEGTDGLILTTTDARGVEVDNIGEERKEPVPEIICAHHWMQIFRCLPCRRQIKHIFRKKRILSVLL